MATIWDGSRLLSLWWQPGKDQQEFPGEISRTDDTVQISLIGTLSGSLFPIDDPEPSILHGLGNQGPLFTARHLLRRGSKSGAPGFTTELLRPQSVIVGAHVDENTRYNEALLQATFLPDWVGISGILIDVTTETEAARGSLGVRYEWPRVQRSELADGTVISTWTSHTGNPSRSGYSITESVALKVSVPTALPVDELIDAYIMPLLDLLSFATRQANGVEHLSLRSPTITQQVKDQTFPLDLQFLTRWIASPVPPQGRLYPHEMNFTLGEAPMGLDKLVCRWFELCTKLRPSLGPYFGLVCAPPRYVDLHLVTVSQILEAYHRATMPQQAMSKDDFKTLKLALLGACPEAHREFITGKLGYLNEITQTERITQLVRKVSGCLSMLLGRRPAFIRDFVAARNARTHPDASKRAFNPIELYDLAQTGRYIFEACIMLDLGFSDTDCATLFERQPEYQHHASRSV